METITEKLQYTADAIDDIQAAINEKGVAVDGSVELSLYGGKIRDIKGEEEENYWDMPKSVIYYTIKDGNWFEERVPFTRGDIVTVRAGENVAEAGVGTIEYNPDLTFDYWVCPYQIVDGKIDTSDIYSDIPIGAIYTPTGNVNVFVIELNPVIGLKVTMWWDTLLSSTTLTIEWGDGTSSIDVTSNTSHTYAGAGIYVIKAKANKEDSVLFGYSNRRSNDSGPDDEYIYSIFVNKIKLYYPANGTESDIYYPTRLAREMVTKAYFYDKINIQQSIDSYENITAITIRKVDSSNTNRSLGVCPYQIETIILPRDISSSAFIYNERISAHPIVDYGIVNMPDYFLQLGKPGLLIIPDTVVKTSMDVIGSAKLTTLVIGKNVKNCRIIYGKNVLVRDEVSIGTSSLINNSNYVKLQNITKIQDGLFYNNSSSAKIVLKKVNIPDTITSIEYDAFMNCKNYIPPFVIPDSVTSVGNNAFREFSGFGKELTTPKLLKIINSNIFIGLPNVETIIIPDGVTIVDTNFSSCPELTKIVIPNTVTEIGGLGLSCPKLKELVIPSSVERIESLPTHSDRCRITVERVSPPVLSQYSFILKAFIKIYVPDESLNVYKTATNWSVYQNYMYPLSQKPIE